MRDLSGARRGLGAGWSLFQLYTAWAGAFDLLIQLPIHAACAVALGFLTPADDRGSRWWDGVAAGMALGCGAYYVAHHPRLITRMPLVDDPLRMDLAVGVLFIALLLWASRRHIGTALVLLALAFAAYAFAGPWLPGFLSHGGVTFGRFVELQTM